LVAAKFVHSRIVNRSENVRNVWVTNLRKTIDEKIVKAVKNRSEAI